MKAEETQIYELISQDQNTFVIPVYQRNYDWHREQCEKLFYDIKNIVETGKEHFLGTILYKQESAPISKIAKKSIVIDGQQRITSVILFAKALYDLSKSDEDFDGEVNRENICSTFLTNSRNKFYRFKLKVSEYDRKIFEKVMDCTNLDKEIFSEEEKYLSIYSNYILFRELITNADCSIGQLADALYRLKIIEIGLSRDEAPQKIFESLNSTGLKLRATDLIRNYLFMDLDYEKQEKLYNCYWLEIECLMGSADVVENFIIQYLVMKRRTVTINLFNKSIHLSPLNLYTIFKLDFESESLNDSKVDRVENFLKDLYRYAGFFSHFMFSDSTFYGKLSELDKKFYELVFLLESTNAPIILMFLYDKYDTGKIDEGTFINFVDALISLTFRAKICKMNAITGQFAGNVVSRLYNKKLDESLFWDAITFGKGKYAFPNDETFKNALVETPLYLTVKSPLCKYLLYSLEMNSERSKELPAYSGASIEHIMPQKLNNDWKAYLDSKDDLQTCEYWLHTFGNLALTGYNSKLSNSDFTTKKLEYEKSNYYYTRELSTYSDWTSKQIQMRANKLANLALKIWKLPEKYNTTIQNVGTIFTLDSDFGFFTGKKLELVSIFNEEKKISNWRVFLSEIVKGLYKIDEDVFRQAVQENNIPRRKLFTSKLEEVITPFEIDKDYFMEVNFSSKDCLRIAKVVVENFDRIGGTNFKDDIWFTLRTDK